MAIDKAVDSAVLDANLTSIADAIRAKAGTSDKLAFPAGFADAIAAIEAGGGESIAVVDIVPSSKISTSSSMTINNPLGKVPDWAILSLLYKKGEEATVEQNAIYITTIMKSASPPAGFGIIYNGACAYFTSTNSLEVKAKIGNGEYSTFSAGFTNFPSMLGKASSETIEISGCENNSIPFMQAGVTYRLIMGVFTS